jgi:hypothetical protein
MLKIAETNKVEHAKLEDKRFENLANEFNSKISSIDVRISKINIKLIELSRRVEEAVINQIPLLQNKVEDEDEKRKEEKLKAQFNEIGSKIEAMEIKFQGILQQNKQIGSSIDEKILNKADVELIRDIESKVMSRQNIQRPRQADICLYQQVRR